MRNTIKQLRLGLFFPFFGLFLISKSAGCDTTLLRSLLAASPILVVLVAMLFFRLGGQVAGPIGLLTGLLIAWLSFGITPELLWVSQQKGLLLSLFVIAIFFPALMLYNTVNQANGIQSIVHALECLITDRSILLVTTAWAFSGLMEGVAGFGLPVAIISPMLVGMGVSPIWAVAAVAVGHAWSVTFGDMGVVFQTLTSVVRVNAPQLELNSAILLGIACLLCGLAAAHLLKCLNRWPVVVVLAVIMAFVQYAMVAIQIPALAGMFSGASGVIGAIVINKQLTKKTAKNASRPEMDGTLLSALISYGMLVLIMILIAVIPPLKESLSQVVWTVSFPEVRTLDGFVTGAVPAQNYRPLLHPGTSILFVTFLSYLHNRWRKLYRNTGLTNIVTITWKTSWPATAGIFSMVGLSSLMDHSGMTVQLASALSSLFQAVFPLISPIIGMIGAFATGSNNNSNVLFGPLQEGIAAILKLSPAVIVAAQTTGGSLGSMIAPAKIIVGCSTVGLQSHDGEVLRKTIPYGVVIGLLIGGVTFLLGR
jgi:lactate permease